jgi:hypothetical protein
VRLKLALLQLLLIVLISSVPVLAQDSTSPVPPTRVQRPDDLPNEDPVVREHREKLEKVMEKKANQERQAQLKQDTEKLLQLSTELKQYVEKTNENVLSVNVIKKAEEIEKLAHSVKEKMRGNN